MAEKNGDPIGRPEILDGIAGEFHGSPSGLPAMPARHLKARAGDRAGREVFARRPGLGLRWDRQRYPRMPESEATGVAP